MITKAILFARCSVSFFRMDKMRWIEFLTLIFVQSNKLEKT
jgi:hypothetical protein